jgi:hypothetical protein
MRLPWQKQRVEHPDPNRPHRFKPVSDPQAIIAMDPAGNAALQGVNLTKASVADEHCAVCRRPHDHSIHDPEE